MTWATSVPILFFLGLSVLDLGLCTRQTDKRQKDRRQIKASLIRGGGIITCLEQSCTVDDPTHGSGQKI